MTVKLTIDASDRKARWKDHDDMLHRDITTFVAGVIRDDQGRYLMIYQTENGQWFFPGGKTDDGESLQDALYRELREEV